MIIDITFYIIPYTNRTSHFSISLHKSVKINPTIFIEIIQHFGSWKSIDINSIGITSGNASQTSKTFKNIDNLSKSITVLDYFGKNNVTNQIYAKYLK